MTALIYADAEALLRRQSKNHRLAQRALRAMAARADAISGGVIPIEDALRTYEVRLRLAQERGRRIGGASKLLTRLRQSNLDRVAVFSASADDHYLVFFSDPACETLLASVDFPPDLAAVADG